MKLFGEKTVKPEKIQDDTSNDTQLSDKMYRFERDLAQHKNKSSTEYKHIQVQLLEECITVGYSLGMIRDVFFNKHKLPIDFHNSFILRCACFKGNLKFVKLLIQEFGEQIKLDDFNQSPIQYAVQSGNAELVNFLLQHSCVNPSHLIVPTLAVIGNHVVILVRLLQDDRIDQASWNHALGWAKELFESNPDYSQVVQLLQTKIQ